MTEIPEHLLKRAQAAREKSADAAPAAPQPPPTPPRPPKPPHLPTRASPTHLLQRSKAAKAAKAGGAAEEAPAGGGAVAVAEKVGAVVAAPRRPAAACRSAPAPVATPSACSPWSSRGSIQDVKATPVDKVHTWPHLLAAEFVVRAGMTAFVVHLLGVRQRPAAAARQHQPDPQPVEGAVVLPRPAGTARPYSTRWSPA